MSTLQKGRRGLGPLLLVAGLCLVRPPLPRRRHPLRVVGRRARRVRRRPPRRLRPFHLHPRPPAGRPHRRGPPLDRRQGPPRPARRRPRPGPPGQGDPRSHHAPRKGGRGRRRHGPHASRQPRRDEHHRHRPRLPGLCHGRAVRRLPARGLPQGQGRRIHQDAPARGEEAGRDGRPGHPRRRGLCGLLAEDHGRQGPAGRARLRPGIQRRLRGLARQAERGHQDQRRHLRPRRHQRGALQVADPGDQPGHAHRARVLPGAHAQPPAVRPGRSTPGSSTTRTARSGSGDWPRRTRPRPRPRSTGRWPTSAPGPWSSVTTTSAIPAGRARSSTKDLSPASTTRSGSWTPASPGATAASLRPSSTTTANSRSGARPKRWPPAAASSRRRRSP